MRRQNFINGHLRIMVHLRIITTIQNVDNSAQTSDSPKCLCVDQWNGSQRFSLLFGELLDVILLVDFCESIFSRTVLWLVFMKNISEWNWLSNKVKIRKSFHMWIQNVASLRNDCRKFCDCLINFFFSFVCVINVCHNAVTFQTD